MNEDKNKIIDKTAEYVKNELEGEGSGHDWWHVYRVWQNAKYIGKQEKADMFVVELAALLHDIADWKMYKGDEDIGPRKAGDWLENLEIVTKVVDHIKQIIKNVSFKGAKVDDTMNTIEGKVVQDSDRLDSMGAIGIARAFAYGGYKDREIYNPNEPPTLHESKEAYSKNSTSVKGTHTINHFYEKLLLLKDRMKTETGKIMAQQRHEFMEEYLDQFYKEWEGEK